MYGSTDMTTLRTSASPSRGSRTSVSASRKSSGTGQPRGRRMSCHSRLVGMSGLPRSDEHRGGSRVGDGGREDEPVDRGGQVTMGAARPDRAESSADRSDDEHTRVTSGGRAGVAIFGTPVEHQ